MIALHILGPHTQLGSSLCAKCPQGPAGCCVAPPHVDWSDVARIVAGGGRDFLLARIAKKDLVPADDGLRVRRVKRREAPTEPMERKCVFHGPGGCTIGTELRPATCNYFLCEDAFVEGGERKGTQEAVQARRTHAALKRAFEGWDEALAARVAEAFPEGPPWDAAFLDWIGEAFQALTKDLAPLTLADHR